MRDPQPPWIVRRPGHSLVIPRRSIRIRIPLSTGIAAAVVPGARRTKIPAIVNLLPGQATAVEALPASTAILHPVREIPAVTTPPDPVAPVVTIPPPGRAILEEAVPDRHRNPSLLLQGAAVVDLRERPGIKEAVR